MPLLNKNRVGELILSRAGTSQVLRTTVPRRDAHRGPSFELTGHTVKSSLDLNVVGITLRESGKSRAMTRRVDLQNVKVYSGRIPNGNKEGGVQVAACALVLFPSMRAA